MSSQNAQDARSVEAMGGEELYFSVEQVARRLQVSARWLADQCREGRVEHVHLARKRKFTPEQVQKLLRDHTIQPAEVEQRRLGGNVRPGV
ncbi:helix-turn-helix domain-containing protein [Nucisporomicrobium flavum]|uniref:helix-turn-helix domain-containing protein n=1 Tax=Nucisporomicrobium flavum TaxID=2785915 RepID=UPI0018F65978|nr:helix-turn-helix domain-containing protein [Nucisporomicrobium flavum]